MNIYYTFILFASILLFSNSLLALRIDPHSYEQYQENIPASKMMKTIPTEDDINWPQYVLPPLYQTLDQRLRRGWGSGRRRRSDS